MSTCFSNTSRDGDSTTSLGSLFQCLTTLSLKNFFLISNLNLTQLEAIASCPITSYLGEAANTCLTTTSFQVVIESNKVSPQPPLLQNRFCCYFFIIYHEPTQSELNKGDEPFLLDFNGNFCFSLTLFTKAFGRDWKDLSWGKRTIFFRYKLFKRKILFL